jgi:hypothetical protein
MIVFVDFVDCTARFGAPFFVLKSDHSLLWMDLDNPRVFARRDQ